MRADLGTMASVLTGLRSGTVMSATVARPRAARRGDGGTTAAANSGAPASKSGVCSVRTSSDVMAPHCSRAFADVNELLTSKW